MSSCSARCGRGARQLEARARPLPCAGDHNRLIRPFLARLGFELTASQTKVLREIRRDMGGPAPMRRLLQGDVGSGKTVVAACAMLMALESGADAALMAPTEILAEQHGQNFRRWMEPLGVRVEVRTGGCQGRRAGTAAVAGGAALYIGTHALLEESFAPARLGLVIIDEQHKFGVAQREQLVRKGSYPHLLVMTATPIPRTLGLTLYGDLDISVIEQGPPGRGRVKTFLRAAESLPKVWAFLREKLAQGRQALRDLFPGGGRGHQRRSQGRHPGMASSGESLRAVEGGAAARKAQEPGKGIGDGGVSRAGKPRCCWPPRWWRWAWTCPTPR